MKPFTRLPILLGSCVLLLCALLAWKIIGRPASCRPHADPGRPPASISHPAILPAASPAPSAPDVAISPRLQLERRCLALAENDPLAAMELALKNNLTADDPGLLTSLIMQWAARDFDAAHAWTKTQEAGVWRDNMLAHVAYLRAKTDPVAAARIVVTDIQAGPARDEATLSVLHQWALRNPNEAQLWVEALPEGPFRTRASAEVANLRLKSSAGASTSYKP